MQEVDAVQAFEAFKPESCVFVLSVDGEGRPSGMIAGWNTKCSFDPPLFAVSLSKGGFTHTLIRASEEFVIAVPNKQLQEELKYFGSVHGDKVDKFRETGIETTGARHVKTPLLKEATVNFECRLEKEVDVGDHFMYIGRVVASYVNREKKVLLNMKKVDGERVYEEF
jgi:flavin reductase (DIM6/NTAB) family NADH-FMN oxidoreductase RutF